jgi:hypothetical protein
MRDNIPREFFDRFDTIIIMHVPEWIEANWERMKHKRVIWRTIGQSTPALEMRMKRYVNEGLEIVRYSPTERRLENYAGENALIRFYKDEEEFSLWNGQALEMITIAQNMKQRGEFCNYGVFEEMSRLVPSKLYGNKNEESGELSGGYLSYDEMKQKYREGRMYFYTGTQPAAYTLNFIEAFMTGIPIVAIGEKIANSLGIAGKSYEVQEILESGDSLGLVGYDIPSLKHYVELLYNNRALADKISQSARIKAISLFGKKTVKQDWKNYLKV